MAYDWKKAEKKYYMPANKPELINMPAFSFFSIKGQGDPNDDKFGEYIQVLYSLSYAVKMSPKKGQAPAGYFEYSIYPLEGVWDITDEAKKQKIVKLDKSTLVFELMIRQPDFVTAEYVETIIMQTKNKKPHPLLDQVRFVTIEEKKCIQMLHHGSYDDEPASFNLMEDYCASINLKRESKIHREIYLSDARRVSKDKLKTVLRFKIAENG
jgi:hypothetical protein